MRPNWPLLVIAFAFVGLIAFALYSSSPSRPSGQIDVEDLEVIYGNPDYAKAKLKMIDFWAVW